MAFIGVTGAIGDGTLSGKIDMSLIFKKQLEVLMSKNLMIPQATIENYDENAYYGTVVYYVTRRNVTRDYSDGTLPNENADMRPVEILLDKSKEYAVELKRPDLIRLGAKYEDNGITIRDAYLTGWMRAIAVSMMGYKNAKLVQLGINTAVNNGIINITLPAVPTIDDYRQKLWKPIVDELARMKSLISYEYFGLDEEDFYLWTSPRMKNLLILAVANLGSEISTEKLIDGSITMIGGLKLHEVIFLGNNYPQGLIDGNETFDFSEADLILEHREALASPMNQGIQTTMMLQTNLAVQNKGIFMVNTDGGKPLRSELVRGFKVTITDQPLSEILTMTNLRKIVFAGAIPTSLELDAGATASNPQFVGGGVMATWGTITSTSAIATPVSPYTGSPITVSFTKNT